MARIVPIDGFDRPELEVYVSRRPDEGLFVAESPTVIGYALDAGCVPVSALAEKTTLEGRANALLARCGDIPVYTAGREALRRLTGFALTRGVMAAFRRPEVETTPRVCEGARRLAVLDGVADPANVGAIFRSAAALGFDGVLLTRSCADPLYRKALRVSMGAAFRVKWAWMEDRDWQSLKDAGWLLAAMALHGRSVALTDPALNAAQRLAVVLGREGTGLSEDTLRRCDCSVRIPMMAGIDSLNVAAAAAVAFWQLGPCARGDDGASVDDAEGWDR